LQKDTLDLNLLLSRKNDQWESSKSVLTYFANPDEVLFLQDTAAIIRNISFPFNFYSDIPNKTAFETSKSSGDLYKITNDSLVDLIATYFSDSDLSQYLLTTKNFTINYSENVLMKKYRLKEININYLINSAFFKDFEMENYYAIFSSKVKLGIFLIGKKIKSNINLMKLIEAEFARDDLKE